MKVAIVDYGMGNLNSVEKAFRYCGADVEIIEDVDRLELADKIVIPGVGAFGDGVRKLDEGGWRAALDHVVNTKSTPTLGICLGMQLLADSSEEGAGARGLGYIEGRVVRIPSNPPEFRVPHVGWNECLWQRESALTAGIPTGVDFYFVHAYHFEVTDTNDIVARTPHGIDLCSVVERDNVFGVQFHPEKSSRWGFHLIKNFIGL